MGCMLFDECEACPHGEIQGCSPDRDYNTRDEWHDRGNELNYRDDGYGSEGDEGDESEIKIFCISCGKDADEGWLYCPGCGSAIPKIHACVSCDEVVLENWKYCISCGDALPELQFRQRRVRTRASDLEDASEVCIDDIPFF